jgi:hypothetical protein
MMVGPEHTRNIQEFENYYIEQADFEALVFFFFFCLFLWLETFQDMAIVKPI